MLISSGNISSKSPTGLCKYKSIPPRGLLIVLFLCLDGDNSENKEIYNIYLLRYICSSVYECDMKITILTGIVYVDDWIPGRGVARIVLKRNIIA